MKLNEIYSRPLKEVIAELELSDMKIHADDSGDVKAVELKYTEKQTGRGQKQAHGGGECGAKVR